MPPLPGIKDFDELKHISLGLSSCLILSPMHSFPFKQGKETFRDRIVEAIPGPTHAVLNAMVPQQILKLMAGILTTVIAVMNEIG